MSKDNRAPPKKILLMGLDNSGKTSIVLSLQNDTNLMSYYSLKPTHGIDIINIISEGKRFNIWDCGGQKRFRIEYLKDLDRYTRELDKLIYVIDVQDTDRYDLALKYLKDIIDYLEINKRYAKLSIFFHKYDPGIEDRIKITGLIEKIRDLIPEQFDFDIFKTTIYTIFQKTHL
ncbi:MAG: hypothetical protein GF329_18620 [Candidatus Lokiarchaeota archaeon]|nr:hypothetical protein [Candidatus Lokiarchaeota archaeon]